jgi:hypothetical protein
MRTDEQSADNPRRPRHAASPPSTAVIDNLSRHKAEVVLKLLRPAGMNRNPVTSPPGRCLACGDREYGYDPLLPYGVEPTGHAWLHSRCWEAWHAARKREAAAALKAMGVGTTCNEMKDGPGHGEGGPKKICDQPPNTYGP